MRINSRLGFCFWVTLFLGNLISYIVARWNDDPWALVNIFFVGVSLYFTIEHVEFE